jgi:hypothetical protein
MNEINQLILDCMACVLRINQTTDANIMFQFNSQKAIECQGYKRGYDNSPKRVEIDGRLYPERDYLPLKDTQCGWIGIKDDGAEMALKNLLLSLGALEKELMTK